MNRLGVEGVIWRNGCNVVSRLGTPARGGSCKRSENLTWSSAERSAAARTWRRTRHSSGRLTRETRARRSCRRYGRSSRAVDPAPVQRERDRFSKMSRTYHGVPTILPLSGGAPMRLADGGIGYHIYRTDGWSCTLNCRALANEPKHRLHRNQSIVDACTPRPDLPGQRFV